MSQTLRELRYAFFWNRGDKDVDRFPPLSVVGRALHLPLCDTTALELVRALLHREDPCSREIILHSLQWDPVLALWCVCQAGDHFDQLPTSGEIADWFLSHGFLHFESTDRTRVEATDNECVDDDLASYDFGTIAVISAAPAGEDIFGESTKSQASCVLGLLIESLTLLEAIACKQRFDSSVVRGFIPQWLYDSLKKIESTEELPDDLPEAYVRKLRQATKKGIDKLEGNAHRIAEDYRERAAQRFRAEIPAARGTLSVLCSKLLRLQKLEHEFQATLEREKLASLKQLAYGASHEINNPLANISTRAQTLLRDEVDPERRRQLSTINSQAFRAHEMISDMMLFAHPPKLQPEMTDVRALVEQVIVEFATDARQQGTQLSLQAGDDSPLWNLDPIQLTVALKALVRNSIEALGSAGQVVLSWQMDEGESGVPNSVMEIRVSDDGPGISDAIHRHLFDPFFSGREAGRGLGFGLAKCWRIVELHGGEVLVDSRPRRGTTIAIRLPRLMIQEESASRVEPVRVENS